MPVVDPPAKVLVTGSNGFIAVWIVRTLLERGFSVRGTIRSESKGGHLRNLFKDEVQSGKFELIVVSDFADPSAFDSAVRGVDAIVHTASPAHHSADDPNENILPAVNGTVGVLESALRYAGPQLKRVAITSSCAAIVSPSFEGVANESIWNEESAQAVEEKGRNVLQIHKYLASKTLAEKAAWDFVSKNSSVLSWDLVTLLPTWCFGPVLHEVTTASSLNPSTIEFYNALSAKSPEEFSEFQSSWVDVRDIAEAHVRALEVPEAGGQRFIISAEEFIWQDWYDIANELNLPGVTVPIGTLVVGKDCNYKVRVDSTKAREVLGMNFRTKEQTFKDIISDYQLRGWKLSGGF